MRIPKEKIKIIITPINFNNIKIHRYHRSINISSNITMRIHKIRNPPTNKKANHYKRYNNQSHDNNKDRNDSADNELTLISFQYPKLCPQINP